MHCDAARSRQEWQCGHRPSRVSGQTSPTRATGGLYRKEPGACQSVGPSLRAGGPRVIDITNVNTLPSVLLPLVITALAIALAIVIRRRTHRSTAAMAEQRRTQWPGRWP